MDKEFETLVVKPIKDTTLDCMNDLIGDLEQYEQWFDNEEYCKEELQWLKGWSERVKEDLLELKAIKESNPSEALMELEVLKDILNEFLKNNLIDKAFNTIKQALLKAQEQEKVLEIIKKKIIWVENGKLMCGRYADIEIELEEDDFENSGEFNLLNRWSEK